MTPSAFVSAARQLKGARWRHRGRKPWALDCIGVIVLAAKHCGLELRDEGGYGREPWDDRLRKACRERWGVPLPPEAARPGDVVLIRWARGDPSHIAIVGDHPRGGLTLIHAHNLHGVVECSLAPPYAQCVIEVYRPAWAEGARVNS
jgi:cell wall-associated NlpC family hydrolase